MNRAPDCANVDSFSVPLFIQQKALTPLDEHFSKQEVDDLFPYVRDVITGPDGHIYAWWWSTDLRVIYRNTDLVPDAPRTWDELLAAAKKAHDAKGVDGYLFNGGRWEGDDVRQPRLLLDAGRRAAGQAGQAAVRQGRERREDAQRPALPAQGGHLRRDADPRRHLRQPTTSS